MKRTTEKTKHIAVRTVRFTVIASIVLGLASLLVGLHVYRNTILDESVRVNRTTAAKAAMVAQKSEDSAGLARDVMGVYDSLTPEQRNRTGTEEYRVYFRGLDSVSGADGTSTILSYKLRNYAQEVSAVYLCALYREGNAMVCLADSAEENPMYPGEWFRSRRNGRRKTPRTETTTGPAAVRCIFSGTRGKKAGSAWPYSRWRTKQKRKMLRTGFPHT